MGRVFLYVLRSEQDDSFYVGMTSRLHRRIKEHNAGSSAATLFEAALGNSYTVKRARTTWKGGSGRSS